MKKLLLNLFFGLLAITAFSQTPDNWTVLGSAVTIEQESTLVNEGLSSAKVTWTSTSNQDIHSDEFDVVGDATYSYSLNVYDNTNAGRVRMVIAFDGSLTYTDTYSVDLANWQTLNITGTVPTGATKGYVKLRFYDESAGWSTNGNQATLYVDNATYVEGAGSNMITNGDFETWPVFANITGTEYVNATELDIIYDGSITSVDPADYNLTGTAAITFTGATIDGTDDKIVHLTGASASITGDATLDNIADANVDFDFYAGILPIATTNANNPGGTIVEDIPATFQGIVSANDAFNNVWIADAAGAYNGILIYDYDFDGLVAVGDEIVFSGILDIYNNLSEIKNPVLIEQVSTGNTPYGPSTITGADISDVIAAETDPAESWEGQLVKIENIKVTVDVNTDNGGGHYYYTATDDAGTTTFKIGDNVDYEFGNITLTVDNTYNIIGVVDYDYGVYRINPRSADDIVSTVAQVSSTKYTVDQDLETITGVPFTAPLADFESNITADYSGAFETYDADGITVADDLATGYKVIATAEDGTTTKTYVITIDAVSTDATLSDLQVSGTTVTDFASGTYTYAVELDAGTTATPAVIATENHEYANAVVTPAEDVNGDTEAKRTTTITVTAEDGTTTQDYTIVFSVASGTGINEIANGFKIYPNPSSGMFTVEMNNVSNGEYSVEVYDVIGKMIYKSQITESITDINLTHMNAGLYYVSVNNGNEKNITKIMIQ